MVMLSVGTAASALAMWRVPDVTLTFPPLLTVNVFEDRMVLPDTANVPVTDSTPAMLSVPAGTLSIAGVESVTGTFAVSGSTILSSNTLTVNSGGNVNVTSGTLHMASALATVPTDNITISVGGTITQSGGSVDVHDFTTTNGAPDGTYNQSGGTFKQYHDFKNAGAFAATGGTD